MPDGNLTLDNVAQLLAADAGVAWPELPEHPGFSKGRWRDHARWLIRRGAPHADVVDGREQWDGRMAEAVVRNLSAPDAIRLMEVWKSWR